MEYHNVFSLRWCDGFHKMKSLRVQDSIRDLVHVEEQAIPDQAAAALFRRLFNAEIPDFPRHFVARLLAPERPVIGYVHFTPMPDMYLCGGMCLDARAYRHMSAEHRKRIGECGGIAEIMLRACFAELSDKPAIFGYCGDTKAMRVDLRAGFEPTAHTHLIVHWTASGDSSLHAGLIEQAAQLGPF
jgi:hypothetical protein